MTTTQERQKLGLPVDNLAGGGEGVCLFFQLLFICFSFLLSAVCCR